MNPAQSVVESLPMTRLNDETARTDVIHRLRRAEGQLRGVQRMVEEGAGCLQVAQQLSAVRKALDSAYVRMTLCYVEQELQDRIGQGAEAGQFDPMLRDMETLLSRMG